MLFLWNILLTVLYTNPPEKGPVIPKFLRGGIRLLQLLTRNQLSELPIFRNQFLIRAVLCNFPVFQIQDTVALPDGGETVGNDDTRAFQAV